MSALLRRFMTASLCVTGMAFATDATAEPSAMEEVLGILRSEGVIDAGQQEKLMARYAREQKQASQDAAGLLGGFEWYGDLRVRYEAFRFDDDALGNDRDDRDRFRYRARFGFKKKVNDSITVGARLASGGGDNDSTNQTIGGNDDFAESEIFLDRAWLDLSLVDRDGMALNLVAGRVSNPYTWSQGKDFLVWDGDINLEGAHVTATLAPNEDTEVFATLGYFIAREIGGGSDPKVIGAQTGFTSGMFGLRASLYEYRSLDDGFIGDTVDEGNLVGIDGDDDGAFDDGRARVVDLTGFLTLASGDFPVTLYGTYARNLSADSIDLLGMNLADEEENAWGVGIELGDKKKNVEIGAGYFSVEANSVIAQFTDSDLFDGFTNREGFIIYASRQVAKNTDFNLTFFSSEEIEDDAIFADSVGDADRMRLQADIVTKF